MSGGSTNLQGRQIFTQPDAQVPRGCGARPMQLGLQRAPAGLLPGLVGTALHSVHGIVQHPAQLPLNIELNNEESMAPNCTCPNAVHLYAHLVVATRMF